EALVLSCSKEQSVVERFVADIEWILFINHWKALLCMGGLGNALVRHSDCLLGFSLLKKLILV
ncbi:MAG: hypothetical protein QGG94_04550, partial [Prochlorococcaceae cyanobacterium ETNP1_MAG_9]|nr:hypothetical protein [Prochlorococcaceae cyanobacterium ETNP1_MAG_9]